MYKALFLSPMIASADVEATAIFFKDAFQFIVRREESGYIILEKDKLTIHIKNAWTDLVHTELYLEVDNVDNVWELIKDKVEGLRIKEPFDREYGMRGTYLHSGNRNFIIYWSGY